MAISRGQLVKELEPGLNALFGLEYKRYENQHVEIFDTETSDRAFEEEVMLSGFANASIARKTLKNITQYDLNYQKQVVITMYNRAKYHPQT